MLSSDSSNWALLSNVLSNVVSPKWLRSSEAPPSVVRLSAVGEKTDEVLQRQLIPLTQDDIDWNSIVIAVRHLRIQY